MDSVNAQTRRYCKLHFTNLGQLYKNGFGQHGGNTELWLGNDYVHQLTYNKVDKSSEIRLEAYAFNGTNCAMTAKNFVLQDEANSYKIRLNTIKTSRTCPKANEYLSKQIDKQK